MKVATTILVFCVAALLSLGLVILYSSSMQKGPLLQMQLIWASLGITGCIVAASIDYRLLRPNWWMLYSLALILLVVVLIPGQHSIFHNGARRWLNLKVASFQPSELAKIAMIMMLAWYGDRFQRHMGTFVKGVCYPGLLAALFLGLIFVEPDRGTTILLAAVCGTMLVAAGVRWFYVIPPLVLGASAMVFSFMHDPMRSRRIYSWLHLEETSRDVGMQGYQAMIALGSGGWFGLGLGNGRQKLGFVPEHHTDFIFSIIGEELGLVATGGVILAFMLLILSGLYIAWRARDTFGFLLATGITSLIGMQAIINIGVVTSALPNKGLPLPFISYGGSSLLIMLTSIGLLLSVARQAPMAEPHRKERRTRRVTEPVADNPFAA